MYLSTTSQSSSHRQHTSIANNQWSARTPENMLRVIAAALNEQPATYQLKTRIRNVVELRFIAALCLRSNFPNITLQQIAAFFGGQDHTSVINGLARAYALIYAGDESLTERGALA